jgi:hypothetical protein
MDFGRHRSPHPDHPAVNLFSILALKTDSVTGRHKPSNLFQTQLLCSVHADLQSPSCLILQADLVLEESRNWTVYSVILNKGPAGMSGVIPEHRYSAVPRQVRWHS